MKSLRLCPLSIANVFSITGRERSRWGNPGERKGALKEQGLANLPFALERPEHRTYCFWGSGCMASGLEIPGPCFCPCGPGPTPTPAPGLGPSPGAGHNPSGGPNPGPGPLRKADVRGVRAWTCARSPSTGTPASERVTILTPTLRQVPNSGL